MNTEILDLKLKGYCCSQIIMEMGLRRLGKENEDLVAAMAGLCDGMWHEGTCGIVSAATCLLYLADPQGASRRNVQELQDWFADMFGTINCGELLEGSPLSKVEKCPMMLENTILKISEMLEW